MLRWIRRRLITGLLVWTPIAITFWVITFVFSIFDSSSHYLPISWQAKNLFGTDLPGFGALVTVTIIFLTGLLAANILGQQLLSMWENLLTHIPVINSIYKSVKQISDTFLSQDNNSFSHVVLIRYPHQNSWTIAFVTSEKQVHRIQEKIGTYISVYVPTTPNPTSGFMLLVSPDDVIPLDLSVEDTLKYVLSIGVIAPPTKITENTN